MSKVLQVRRPMVESMTMVGPVGTGSGLGALATLGASGRSAVDCAWVGAANARVRSTNNARCGRRVNPREERKGREGCAKDAEGSSTEIRLDEKG